MRFLEENIHLNEVLGILPLGVYNIGLHSEFMRKIALCVMVSVVLFSCQSKPASVDGNVPTDSIKTEGAKTEDWSSLKKYVGTFPKENDFFKNPIVESNLKKILGSSYDSYAEHVALSGCGSIAEKDGLIFGDVSQMHVSGYVSIFYIDVANSKMYLFWMNGEISEKKYQIYGEGAIPENVLSLTVQSLNETWSHVASFAVVAQKIDISLK